MALSVLTFAACTQTETESEEMNQEETEMTQNNNMQQDEMQQQNTIADVAMGNQNLSTLVKAVQAGGLVETLSSEGPYTVFAPTNDAFNALDQSTLDNLLMEENQDQLKNILTYHVVEGSVMAADLSDGQTVTTLQGNELEVSIQDGNVMINGAQVVTADVEASNGVVHVIDQVLMPAN